MRYASVCSGVEAASLAWQALGWDAAWFSEVEPFPCAVLATRFPKVPNLGDMTKIEGEKYHGTVDLLVGGTPCQDVSVAGKRKGFAGERDLWPVFANLIRECRPRIIFGEQVENAVRHGWLDRVYADMEGAGYAVGAAVLGAHSVSAPHQRQRLYWGCVSVADGGSAGLEGRAGKQLSDQLLPRETGMASLSPWSNSRYIYCRDQKIRRIPAESIFLGVADGISSGVDGSGIECISESGGFPLTTRKEGRAMLLKGYGNAIVPQVAAEFIMAFTGGIKWT